MFLKLGIMAIVVSAILYTLAIWGERLIFKKLNIYLFIIFVIGFFCDLLGTGIMYFYSHGHENHVHSMSGCLAIFIMAIHFIFAYLAMQHQKWQIRFHKGSIFAWMIWMFAFLNGLMM